MNTQTQEALKQAREALHYCFGATEREESERRRVIKVVEEAIEQPAQEPVAWRWKINRKDNLLNEYQYLDNGAPDYTEESEALYTHPAQPWQGLTADELEDIKDNSKEGWYQLVRNVEQALRERNT
jgi:hypothetical protein